jgi:ParB-like chromosome segregation protein Spo0J
MSFLDKAKAVAGTAADRAKDVAETATAKAKEGVEEVQTKRGLSHAYEQLGRTAYELAGAGEISHARLSEGVAEIRELELRLAEPATHVDVAVEPEPAPATGGADIPGSS